MPSSIDRIYCAGCSTLERPNKSQFANQYYACSGCFRKTWKIVEEQQKQTLNVAVNLSFPQATELINQLPHKAGAYRYIQVESRQKDDYAI